MKTKSRAVRNIVLLFGSLLLMFFSFSIGRWYEVYQVKQDLKVSVIGAFAHELSAKTPYAGGILGFERADIRATGSTPHPEAIFVEFGDELLVTTVKKPEDIEGVTFPAKEMGIGVTKQDVE